MADALDTELLRESAAEVLPTLRRAPLLLLGPSLLFAAGAALDAFAAPLHSAVPAAVAVARAAGWAVYLGAMARHAGGVARAPVRVPFVAAALVFLALEAGGLSGLGLAFAVFTLPVAEYALLYGEPVEGVLGGTLDTLRQFPLTWGVVQAALLVVLVMLWLVLGLPMSLFSTYASRESAWLADLIGGALVGPVVHLAWLFRARLFLALHGDPA